MSSLETEYIETLYFEEDPEEIARIRVRFTQIKRNLHKVTTQLEGNINGKWFPLIRYDFDPREKMPLHIQKEYISVNHKKPIICNPKDLIDIAKKEFKKLLYKDVINLIQKRRQIFLKEGK